MHPRQQLRGRLLVALEHGDLVIEAFGWHSAVSRPAIRVDHAARLDVLHDKWLQTLSRGVHDPPHSDPSDAMAIFLSGNDHQSFDLRLPPSHPLFQSTHIGLVHLDSAGKPITARAHHGSPQLVQPSPGRLVTSQSKHSLETQRAGPVLLARHPPQGAEPQHQRPAGVLEDRSCGHRGLMPTIAAFQTHRPKRPRLATAAARTTESLWPA